jgi:LysR family glycine cleavage system transcriptional activator
MKRNLPPLNSIKAFEAAARLESFSLAAAELYVTHGAISRHIHQLEDWLGLSLFSRRHRGVELTEAGASYLIGAGAALDRLAVATARLLERRQHRVLRINAMATFALRWLVPRLSAFQLLHPNIEIRITTSNEPVARIGASFDVVIRGGPDTVPGYSALEFLSESRLPVCSPDLLSRLPLGGIEDLRHHTLLHTATLPTVWADWLELAGSGDLQPRQSLTFEHFYVTIQGALDGLGIAIGPTALVADDVAEGRLVRPFAGPTLPAWRYHAYVATDRSDEAAIASFCEWLRAVGQPQPS